MAAVSGEAAGDLVRELFGDSDRLEQDDEHSESSNTEEPSVQDSS